MMKIKIREVLLQSGEARPKKRYNSPMKAVYLPKFGCYFRIERKSLFLRWGDGEWRRYKELDASLAGEIAMRYPLDEVDVVLFGEELERERPASHDRFGETGAASGFEYHTRDL